jgi:quinoprotein glucose dehydrogenase
MYVADWVGMWDKIDKGRIWKVADPERLKDPRVLEVKKLIAEGMKERPVPELTALMAHADQRIRQAAQFELAARKESGALSKLLDPLIPQMGRIHAIWGLGQLKAKEPLLPLLGDADAEIRAQAAKTLGGLKTVLAYDKFIALLKDESPRVRFFAAMGLGKIGKRDAIPAVIDFLRTNNNDDRMLQHAGILALTWIEDIDAIVKLAGHESPAVRMAALVALRKLQRPEAAKFLADPDPKIVLEAARAIYDTPIPAAFEELLKILSTPAPERAQLRALNAAFRLGHIQQVFGVARTARFSPALRLEALRIMAEWDQPSGRDRLMGLWRPIPARPRQEAIDFLQAGIGGLLQQGPPEVAMEGARLAVAFKITDGLGDFLHGTLSDGGYSGEMMASALRALAELKDPRFAPDVVRALKAKEPELVREAVRLVPQAKVENGTALLEALVTGEGPVPIRQAAIASLGELGADASLGSLLDRGVPAALQLDLAETAAKRPSLKAKASALQPSLQEGGDGAAGRRIFFERSDVQCVRCHTIGAEGGQVGPPLTKIAEQKTREYLLESILTPNKQIAEGWGQTAFQLQNDAVEVGRIEKESDAEVMLILPDGQRKTLAKAAIKARKAALSSMPEDIAKQLSKRDLRDLVEFLSTLK